MKTSQAKSAIIDKFRSRNKKNSNKWETYNDQLNTVLFDNEDLEIRRKDLISLEEDEFPLLECNLSNGSYFLMTTHRVYSFFRNYLQEREYEDLEGLHTGTFFFNDPKLGNKTELYAIQCKNKSLLFYEIDGGQPSFLRKRCLELFWEILES
ncbi:MAG: hypothetical protein HC880_22175 [Bacteroidia bacterium]|nr:hypothetical protein [Bacteroidia bacterium]